MDVKPEELRGCQGGYTRLTGTTLAPLSCHQPQLGSAERTSVGRGWREAGGVSPEDISPLLTCTVYSLLMYYFPGGGGGGCRTLTEAVLTFEIIWISVELIEVPPSLPWLTSALLSRTPLRWRTTGFIEEKNMFSSTDLSLPKANCCR